MKKCIVGIFVSAACTFALAVPQTELSRKVRLLPDGESKAGVIRSLGKPSHIYLPADFKEQQVDGDKSLAYIFIWVNPPCSAIEIWFNKANRVTGMDGGEFCGDKLAVLGPLAARPKDKYSCKQKSRKNFCE